jgi:hypothetical protein
MYQQVGGSTRHVGENAEVEFREILTVSPPARRAVCWRQSSIVRLGAELPQAFEIGLTQARGRTYADDFVGTAHSFNERLDDSKSLKLVAPVCLKAIQKFHRPILIHHWRSPESISLASLHEGRRWPSLIFPDRNEPIAQRLADRAGAAPFRVADTHEQ